MSKIKTDPDSSLRLMLMDMALKAGADAADVIAVRGRSLDVSVRRGVIEDAGSAEEFGIGLRVFKGVRYAYGSTADATEGGLRKLAEQVCAMAGSVPEDPYCRLAEAGMLCRTAPDLDLFDETMPLDIPALSKLAQEAEGVALEQAGITKSDSANASQSFHVLGLTTSNGFNAAYRGSGVHVSLSVIAGEGDGMETDHASASATHVADLESAKAVGLRAATRAIARLSPSAGKTGSYPVLFDRRVSASLLRSFSRCIAGPRLAKGTSFLCDKLGRSIFSSGVTIIDDPLKVRGLRSCPFDGEGLQTVRTPLVEDGVLKSYLLDIRSAARLGLKPTGHATRGLSSPPSPSPSNLFMAAGTQSREALIGQISDGFLVTDLMGASISLTTGDYSRGASGFWIENGAIAYPVSEMTIAGNLIDMFKRMTPASDLEFRDGIDAPSLLIEGMTTASR